MAPEREPAGVVDEHVDVVDLFGQALDVVEVLEVGTDEARARPSFVSESAIRRPRSSLRPVITTSAPSAAYARAIASPIPEVPPVTSTVLP